MRASLVAIVLALLGAGCATTSIRADLDRIETISGHALPPDVLDRVDPVGDARAREILRAPLDADDAVRLAIANHRELRAALRELGIERGRVLQAGLLPNPEIEIDLRSQDDPEQPLQVELYAEFELTHALLTPMRVDVASRELDAARFRAAGRVIETAYLARATFYDAQAAEQRLAVAVRALDALAAARDTATMLFDAGNVPELDLATQIAAYEEARAVTAELELARAASRERLHRVLGLHGDATEWTIAAPLDDVPEESEIPDALERQAIESSVELAETRMRLEAIAGRVGLSRTEGWLPDVTVDVHAEQDGQTWEMGGGASIELPLFDRNEGTTAAYEAEFDGLMERYEGAAIDIRSAARDARNRLVSAHLRAKQYGTVIVPARARVFRQTLLQYNAMQVGVFELVTALRAQLAAELSSIDALRDYWTARAAMEALLRGRRVSGEVVSSSTGIGAGEQSAGGH
ncbi:TolC family protein [Sandaracinus amylolyticus]|uniref:TolC family protein n=1 Tax=Sandaracinus amylolyticus TaxID=927083 RepID=UPI00069E33B3|nr:TolC family protein [Sandaracinus amylolyticus]